MKKNTLLAGLPAATSRYWTLSVLLALACVGLSACSDPPTPTTDGSVTPVYDRETGRLSELLSDRNKDGRNETRGVMDGALLRRVEIDNNNDGTAERVEYYETTLSNATAPQIQRAEERDANGRVTRTETYAKGVIAAVVEDTDGDGRSDKWERYEAGRLAAVDLDLEGVGRATRRLVYDVRGNVARVEADADGDGSFDLVR